MSGAQRRMGDKISLYPGVKWAKLRTCSKLERDRGTEPVSITVFTEIKALLFSLFLVRGEMASF